jgi:hypothetical protein
MQVAINLTSALATLDIDALLSKARDFANELTDLTVNYEQVRLTLCIQDEPFMVIEAVIVAGRLGYKLTVNEPDEQRNNHRIQLEYTAGTGVPF